MTVGIAVGLIDERLTRELRRAVLRPALAPGDPLPGDDLPEAVHFGATDEAGTVLAACFVYPDLCPWLPQRAGSWHLRQMATAADARGRGIGGLVLAAAVGHLRGRSAPLLWCNARERAVAFYARHGFRTHGGIFTDERHQIPHQRMWRELASGSTSSG